MEGMAIMVSQEQPVLTIPMFHLTETPKAQMLSKLWDTSSLLVNHVTTIAGVEQTAVINGMYMKLVGRIKSMDTLVVEEKMEVMAHQGRMEAQVETVIQEEMVEVVEGEVMEGI